MKINWKTIGSSPKDKRVLLYAEATDECCVAAFTRLSHHQAIYGWIVCDAKGQGKVVFGGEPTHWSEIDAPAPTKGRKAK